jgi:hypothetical protein
VIFVAARAVPEKCRFYYDADGSGPGLAQIVATFQGVPAITATDIVVI